MSETHIPRNVGVSNRADALGWALALIWIGVAMLANLGWAWLAIGLGAIVLGVQAALRLTHRKASGFWIVCGLVLLAGGLWQLFNLTLPLTPLLLIMLGVGVLLNALRGRPAEPPATDL